MDEEVDFIEYDEVRYIECSLHLEHDDLEEAAIRLHDVIEKEFCTCPRWYGWVGKSPLPRPLKRKLMSKPCNLSVFSSRIKREYYDVETGEPIEWES